MQHSFPRPPHLRIPWLLLAKSLPNVCSGSGVRRGGGFHHPTKKKQGPPGSLGLSPFVFTYKTESISAKLHQNSSAALLIVLHSFAGYF